MSNINHIGLSVKYHADDPLYANDLSFMTDDDWKKLKESQEEKYKKNLTLPTE